MLAYPMTQTSLDQRVDRGDEMERLERMALRTSGFDKVTSLLAALILLLGSLALVLAIRWLFSDDPQGVVLGGHRIAWGAVKLSGDSAEFLAPQAEELVELQESGLRDSLRALTSEVSRVAGSAEINLAERTTSPPSGESQSGGDRRLAPAAGDGSLPRFQRWELEFEARDSEAYARQLDHLGIELGLVGGGIAGLDYLSGLSGQTVLRRGESGAEQRLYFMWTGENPLIHFDRELLERAGVEVDRREILKFIPPLLENQLAKIELEYAMARGQSFESIAKTVFFFESGGDGYRFVVRKQRYRMQKD